jgi:hypothetical protein
MKTTFLQLAWLVVVLTGPFPAASRAAAPADDPKTAVQAFRDDLKRGEESQVVKRIATFPDTPEKLKSVLRFFNMKPLSEQLAAGEGDFEAVDAKSSADTAVVVVKVTRKGGRPVSELEPLYLVRQDGAWRVPPTFNKFRAGSYTLPTAEQVKRFEELAAWFDKKKQTLIEQEGSERPPSSTNCTEIVVAGEGSALVVTCTAKGMPEPNQGDSSTFVVFVTRANGPQLTQELLEAVYSESPLRGIFFENDLFCRSSGLYDDIRTHGGSERVGYRFMAGVAPGHTSAISVGKLLTDSQLVSDPRFDRSWLNDGATLSAVLAVFKSPKTQGGKSDFVRFITPITTKRVSFKK